MLISILTVVGTLISDILLAWLDPRIRVTLMGAPYDCTAPNAGHRPSALPSLPEENFDRGRKSRPGGQPMAADVVALPQTPRGYGSHSNHYLDLS